LVCEAVAAELSSSSSSTLELRLDACVLSVVDESRSKCRLKLVPAPLDETNVTQSTRISLLDTALHVINSNSKIK